MKYLLYIIVNLIRFFFVYIFGYILGRSDLGGRYPGNMKSPKWIKQFSEPKFLLPVNKRGGYSIRIVGIVYDIMIGISSMVLLPIFIIFLFIDFEFASKTSTVWFYSAYLFAVALAMLDGITMISCDALAFLRRKSK